MFSVWGSTTKLLLQHPWTDLTRGGCDMGFLWLENTLRPTTPMSMRCYKGVSSKTAKQHSMTQDSGLLFTHIQPQRSVVTEIKSNYWQENPKASDSVSSMEDVNKPVIRFRGHHFVAQHHVDLDLFFFNNKRSAIKKEFCVYLSCKIFQFDDLKHLNRQKIRNK